MLAATLIVIVSAATAGTLFDKTGGFTLLDRFGLAPFAAFVVAPVVFRTERQRRILLMTLVALGAYLGAMALIELAGPASWVFPRYILDPSLTTHEGRARGPFIEASANGFAMYACGAAAVMVVVTARRMAIRIGAALTAVLCSVGIVLSLTRSVWLSAAVAALVSMLAVRGVRRWIPLAAIVAATIAFATITLVPGLAAFASQRKNDATTVYERQNLIGAALAMTEARPLFGFGWATFLTASDPYFTVTAAPFALKQPEPVHDVYASNLAEIGLVGTGVWLIAMMLALGTPLLSRDGW